MNARNIANQGWILLTIRTNSSKTGKLKFLIDIGAEISVVKESSINLGINYDSTKEINIKGISDSFLKTKGTIVLTFFTQTHEATHVFHVVGSNFGCQDDGILGQDFWKLHRATINYCDRIITMSIVIMKFDSETDGTKDETYKLTLKHKTERIVRLSTKSKGLGIIPKAEILLRVYLAESLTEEINGYFITSIVNTLETEITVDSPYVELEEINEIEEATLKFSSSDVKTNDRISKLRDEIRTNRLSNEEKLSLIKICEEFNDIFYFPGDKLTFTTATEHTIPTPTIDPTRRINTKSYRMPEIHREEVQKQTEQMLRDGIIAPSSSPWNSQILVIPKKSDASGKKWGTFVDFRKLNDATIGDSFPIPVMSEILDALGKSKYFSTIVCASEFLQVPVKLEDQPKTAFSTRGHFQYTRMPFGLKGAPVTFQRLMTTILNGMQGIKCSVYLDDVVVFGEDLRIHNDRLREVFSRMRKYNMKLQPDKCEFLRKEVSYLGHVIGQTRRKKNRSREGLSTTKDYQRA